jgi:hypothetical protein
MQTILGENYYIDLKKIDEIVNIKSSGETEGDQHIAIVKYEMVKLLTDVVLTESDDIDEKMGSKAGSNLSLPFKLAWNTLLMHKIINHL